MSATPEQIAIELDDLANLIRTGTDNGWDYVDDLRAAATLIRAQAERVRVLVEALRKLSFAAQTSGGTAGRDEALVAAIDHAAIIIAKATGAPQ